MRVDRAAADAVQSLELSRCSEIVLLDEDVHGTQRHDQGSERRRDKRDDDQSKYRLGKVVEQHVERARKYLVDAVDVTTGDTESVSGVLHAWSKNTA